MFLFFQQTKTSLNAVTFENANIPEDRRDGPHQTLHLFNSSSLKLGKDYSLVAYANEILSTPRLLQQIVEKNYNKKRQKRQTNRECFRRACDRVMPS